MEKNKQRIVDLFNDFDGTDEKALEAFYAKNVQFQDPVAKINGLPELKKHYAHLYKNVKSIRFDFSEVIAEKNKYGGAWTMHLAASGLNGGREYAVSGFSYIVFGDDDLVTHHTDYLDLGAMVYERLPVQGAIISALKKFLKS